MMRHLFLGHSGSVLLLTHLMVLPADFLLLVALTRFTLFLGPRQWCARPTVPIAAITTAAYQYLAMTTLAVENPAVESFHL
jgi:hypothetical protein